MVDAAGSTSHDARDDVLRIAAPISTRARGGACSSSWCSSPPSPGWKIQDSGGECVDSTLEVLEEATDVRVPDSKGSQTAPG